MFEFFEEFNKNNKGGKAKSPKHTHKDPNEGWWEEVRKRYQQKRRKSRKASRFYTAVKAATNYDDDDDEEEAGTRARSKSKSLIGRRKSKHKTSPVHRQNRAKEEEKMRAETEFEPELGVTSASPSPRMPSSSSSKPPELSIPVRKLSKVLVRTSSDPGTPHKSDSVFGKKNLRFAVDDEEVEEKCLALSDGETEKGGLSSVEDSDEEEDGMQEATAEKDDQMQDGALTMPEDQAQAISDEKSTVESKKEEVSITQEAVAAQQVEPRKTIRRSMTATEMEPVTRTDSDFGLAASQFEELQLKHQEPKERSLTDTITEGSAADDAFGLADSQLEELLLKGNDQEARSRALTSASRSEASAADSEYGLADWQVEGYIDQVDENGLPKARKMTGTPKSSTSAEAPLTGRSHGDSDFGLSARQVRQLINKYNAPKDPSMTGDSEGASSSRQDSESSHWQAARLAVKGRLKPRMLTTAGTIREGAVDQDSKPAFQGAPKMREGRRRSISDVARLIQHFSSAKKRGATMPDLAESADLKHDSEQLATSDTSERPELCPDLDTRELTHISECSEKSGEQDAMKTDDQEDAGSGPRREARTLTRAMTKSILGSEDDPEADGRRDSDFGLSEEQVAQLMRKYSWTTNRSRAMTDSKDDDADACSDSEWGLSDDQLNSFVLDVATDGSLPAGTGETPLDAAVDAPDASLSQEDGKSLNMVGSTGKPSHANSDLGLSEERVQELKQMLSPALKGCEIASANESRRSSLASRRSSVADVDNAPSLKIQKTVSFRHFDSFDDNDPHADVFKEQGVAETDVTQTADSCNDMCGKPDAGVAEAEESLNRRVSFRGFDSFDERDPHSKNQAREKLPSDAPELSQNKDEKRGSSDFGLSESQIADLMQRKEWAPQKQPAQTEPTKGGAPSDLGLSESKLKELKDLCKDAATPPKLPASQPSSVAGVTDDTPLKLAAESTASRRPSLRNNDSRRPSLSKRVSFSANDSVMPVDPVEDSTEVRSVSRSRIGSVASDISETERGRTDSDYGLSERQFGEVVSMYDWSMRRERSMTNETTLTDASHAESDYGLSDRQLQDMLNMSGTDNDMKSDSNQQGYTSRLKSLAEHWHAKSQRRQRSMTGDTDQADGSDSEFGLSRRQLDDLMENVGRRQRTMTGGTDALSLADSDFGLSDRQLTDFQDQSSVDHEGTSSSQGLTKEKLLLLAQRLRSKAERKSHSMKGEEDLADGSDPELGFSGRQPAQLVVSANDDGIHRAFPSSQQRNRSESDGGLLVPAEQGGANAEADTIDSDLALQSVPGDARRRGRCQTVPADLGSQARRRPSPRSLRRMRSHTLGQMLADEGDDDVSVLGDFGPSKSLQAELDEDDSGEDCGLGVSEKQLQALRRWAGKKETLGKSRSISDMTESSVATSDWDAGIDPEEIEAAVVEELEAAALEGIESFAAEEFESATVAAEEVEAAAAEKVEAATATVEENETALVTEVAPVTVEKVDAATAAVEEVETVAVEKKEAALATVDEVEKAAVTEVGPRSFEKVEAATAAVEEVETAAMTEVEPVAVEKSDAATAAVEKVEAAAPRVERVEVAVPEESAPASKPCVEAAIAAAETKSAQVALMVAQAQADSQEGQMTASEAMRKKMATRRDLMEGSTSLVSQPQVSKELGAAAGETQQAVKSDNKLTARRSVSFRSFDSFSDSPRDDDLHAELDKQSKGDDKDVGNMGQVVDNVGCESLQAQEHSPVSSVNSEAKPKMAPTEERLPHSDENLEATPQEREDTLNDEAINMLIKESNTTRKPSPPKVTTAESPFEFRVSRTTSSKSADSKRPSLKSSDSGRPSFTKQVSFSAKDSILNVDVVDDLHHLGPAVQSRKLSVTSEASEVEGKLRLDSDFGLSDRQIEELQDMYDWSHRRKERSMTAGTSMTSNSHAESDYGLSDRQLRNMMDIMREDSTEVLSVDLSENSLTDPVQTVRRSPRTMTAGTDFSLTDSEFGLSDRQLTEVQDASVENHTDASSSEGLTKEKLLRLARRWQTRRMRSTTGDSFISATGTSWSACDSEYGLSDRQLAVLAAQLAASGSDESDEEGIPDELKPEAAPVAQEPSSGGDLPRAGESNDGGSPVGFELQSAPKARTSKGKACVASAEDEEASLTKGSTNHNAEVVDCDVGVSEQQSQDTMTASQVQEHMTGGATSVSPPGELAFGSSKSLPADLDDRAEDASSEILRSSPRRKTTSSSGSADNHEGSGVRITEKQVQALLEELSSDAVEDDPSSKSSITAKLLQGLQRWHLRSQQRDRSMTQDTDAFSLCDSEFGISDDQLAQLLVGLHGDPLDGGLTSSHIDQESSPKAAEQAALEEQQNARRFSAPELTNMVIFDEQQEPSPHANRRSCPPQLNPKTSEPAAVEDQQKLRLSLRSTKNVDKKTTPPREASPPQDPPVSPPMSSRTGSRTTETDDGSDLAQKSELTPRSSPAAEPQRDSLEFPNAPKPRTSKDKRRQTDPLPMSKSEKNVALVTPEAPDAPEQMEIPMDALDLEEASASPKAFGLPEQSSGSDEKAEPEPDLERPSVGMKVKVGSRTGKILKTDDSELPFKVVFDDGQMPEADWVSSVEVMESAKDQQISNSEVSFGYAKSAKWVFRGHLERKSLKAWWFNWMGTYCELTAEGEWIIYDERRGDRSLLESVMLHEGFEVVRTEEQVWTVRALDLNPAQEVQYSWRASTVEEANQWIRFLQDACKGTAKKVTQREEDQEVPKEVREWYVPSLQDSPVAASEKRTQGDQYLDSAISMAIDNEIDTGNDRSFPSPADVRVAKQLDVLFDKEQDAPGSAAKPATNLTGDAADEKHPDGVDIAEEAVAVPVEQSDVTSDDESPYDSDGIASPTGASQILETQVPLNLANMLPEREKPRLPSLRFEKIGKMRERLENLKVKLQHKDAEALAASQQSKSDCSTRASPFESQLPSKLQSQPESQPESQRNSQRQSQPEAEQSSSSTSQRGALPERTTSQSDAWVQVSAEPVCIEARPTAGVTFNNASVDVRPYNDNEFPELDACSERVICFPHCQREASRVFGCSNEACVRCMQCNCGNGGTPSAPLRESSLNVENSNSSMFAPTEPEAEASTLATPRMTRRPTVASNRSTPQPWSWWSSAADATSSVFNNIRNQMRDSFTCVITPCISRERPDNSFADSRIGIVQDFSWTPEENWVIMSPLSSPRVQWDSYNAGTQVASWSTPRSATPPTPKSAVPADFSAASPRYASTASTTPGPRLLSSRVSI